MSVVQHESTVVCSPTWGELMTRWVGALSRLLRSFLVLVVVLEERSAEEGD